MKIFQAFNFLQLIIIAYLVPNCKCKNRIETENKEQGIKPRGPYLIDAFEVPVNESQTLERFPLKANWVILKQMVSITTQLKTIFFFKYFIFIIFKVQLG